jgi:hypothetical protein
MSEDRRRSILNNCKSKQEQVILEMNGQAERSARLTDKHSQESCVVELHYVLFAPLEKPGIMPDIFDSSLVFQRLIHRD